MSARGDFLETARGLGMYRVAAIEAARSGECARIHAASFDAAWDLADFERFLGTPETIAHGAIDAADDRIVGIVLSRKAMDEAEVLTLAVASAHRRRGLARRLLSAHLESLEAAEVAHLFLEVDTGNGAARALYARLGFTPVGERKAYYRAGRARPSAALVLRLDLPQATRGLEGEAGGQRDVR